MAEQIYQNAKLYMGGYDFSGQMNSLALSYSAQALDGTTFGADTKKNVGGVKEVTFNHNGLWESALDAQVFADIGAARIPSLIAPQTGAEGEVCYLLNAMKAAYNPGAGYGELFKFTVSGDGDKLVRGTIMLNGAKTSSGSGTAYQVGSASATVTLYSALHVLAASGTLDVTVNSDDNSGFTSGVQRIAFAQATAIGSEWASLAGPITDDWWRIEYTVSGSFTFVVGVGII